MRLSPYHALTRGSALLEFGAGNETRTRDPDLGKVVLYQLSYSRASRQLYGMFGRWQLSVNELAARSIESIAKYLVAAHAARASAEIRKCIGHTHLVHCERR